jgi:hypothetical protein
LFGKKSSAKSDQALTDDNYLIDCRCCMMHGRGMFFDVSTGELFEGWFKDN